jgi:hypothetical protein
LHKGFKCLDISTGRVYISRDVVFDETVFPFADLYPNAGAVLRKEILLLPDHLQNPNQSGLDCTDSIITNQHTILDDGVQEQGCQNQQLEAATNSSTSEYRMEGVPFPFQLGDTSDMDWPNDSGPCSNINPAGDPTSAQGGTTIMSPSLQPSTPSSPLTPAPLSQSMTQPGHAQVNSSPLVPAESGANNGGTSTEPLLQPPGEQQQLRPRTRAQSGIVKPKIYTDGTIRYGLLC